MAITNTQNPPLAPAGGEGSGGEGAIRPPWESEAPAEPPCVLNRAAAQQELRPPVMAHKPGTSSTQAARIVPAPSRSRLVVAAWSVERGAWSVRREA